MIAVDAMGGDRAPAITVAGSILAAKELGLPVILVGDAKSIEKELANFDVPPGLVEIKHCTQVATMDEAPIDVLRRKKDSSIRVAFDLVKDGQASAAVSAGNSGATLTIGTVVLGKLAGVERPAIAGTFPTPKGRTVVIDIGANVDCKPSFLYQFGLMAEAFVKETLGIPNPKVGLLSIGEEDSKGNELVLRAHELFAAGSLNFFGNVEGRDVFSGLVDIIVCDGFVGNVVLKLAEGAAETISDLLWAELGATLPSRLGAWLAHPAFRRFKTKVDYAEFGGAPLLGLNGVGIISHGISSPKAIRNAIRLAAEMVRTNLPSRLEERLRESFAKSLSENQEPPPEKPHS